MKWAQVVFPGRPLRVERRGCISQGERSPKACSLMLGRNPLYCVVARCASNVVQRTGPASDWRQRTLVVSAQDTPFATETWRGVVCWRGGWFRGWRGGGWRWWWWSGEGGGSGGWQRWCSGRRRVRCWQRAGQLTREMLLLLRRRFVERAKGTFRWGHVISFSLLHLHYYRRLAKGGA